MEKEFIKLLLSIDNTKQIFELFQDFLALSSYSIANFSGFFPDLEEKYKQIVIKYSDIQPFVTLLTLLMDILETNPFQDFLGETYMKQTLYSKGHGQYFTPYALCKACVNTLDLKEIKAKIENNGYIIMNESSCGSGGMIIAFAEYLRKNNIEPQKYLKFTAQDLDRTCYFMCYLQTALTGLKGSVILGDSLSHEKKEVLHTPINLLT